jgi:hypothetical protein
MESKILPRVNHFATDDGQQRVNLRNLLFAAREEIAIRHDHIGELTDNKLTFLADLVREPSDVLGPHSERSFPIQTVILWIKTQSTDCLSGDQPGERHPRIVRGYPRGVGACRCANASRQDLGDRGRRCRSADSIALDKMGLREKLWVKVAQVLIKVPEACKSKP